MSLKAQSYHTTFGDGATDSLTASSPTTVINTPDQCVVPVVKIEKPQSPVLSTVDRHDGSIISACTKSKEGTTLTTDYKLEEYNDFVLRLLLHNSKWPDEEIIFEYADDGDDFKNDVDDEGTATTATATTITSSKKKKKAKSGSKSNKGSSSSKCKTAKKSASVKDSKPRKKRSKRMKSKSTQEGDKKRSRTPKQLKVTSCSSTALSSLSDSVHSSATEVSFFDDVNDDVNDLGNVDQEAENANNHCRRAGLPPNKNPAAPRRHNSAPPRRNGSSSLYIEPILEVAIEEDQSPVRTSQKSSVVLQPTAKRPTMDELRVSLHMAAKDAANVGHHIKLVETVCVAVADGGADGYEDQDDDDENDDWDDYKSDNDSHDDGSDTAVEKKDKFDANALGTSTHHHRHHRRQVPDEWKLKHGLAVENDLSRSNHFRVINEAAALGSMRRRKADVVEVSQACKNHETTETNKDEGDVQGNNNVPTFLKRRRKLLRTASERMDQYVEDAKLEKKKTMFDPEHVLERQEEYHRIEERFSQGDYKWLPTFEPPAFRRQRVWTSRNRLRVSVAEEAAKKAEARNHRLNCILRLKVRKSCPCVYCKNPNPFQTVAFQELRQERRHRQPQKAMASSNQSSLDLDEVPSKKAIESEQKSSSGELYSRTMLRRVVSLSSPIGSSNSFKANKEKRPPSWTLPTLQKAPVKTEKGDPSIDEVVSGWDLATTDFKSIKEKKIPSWAAPTLKKIAVNDTKKDSSSDHNHSEGPGWALATGKRNEDLPDWASPALRNLTEGKKW